MYIVPQNNAVAKITDLKQPDLLRQTQFDIDLQLQLRDFRNTAPGQGPVKGWGR